MMSRIGTCASMRVYDLVTWPKRTIVMRNIVGLAHAETLRTAAWLKGANTRVIRQRGVTTPPKAQYDVYFNGGDGRYMYRDILATSFEHAYELYRTGPDKVAHFVSDEPGDGVNIQCGDTGAWASFSDTD